MSSLDLFLNTLKERHYIYWQAVDYVAREHPELFNNHGTRLLAAAERTLGTNFEVTLADAYASFVADVSLCQARYERSGSYQEANFDEVNESLYSNPDQMESYHWGVYVTNFAWGHHLHIMSLFEDFFAPLLARKQASSVIDLGSGSGAWSFTLLNALSRGESEPNLKISLVDISETSIRLAKKMAEALEYERLTEFHCCDARELKEQGEFDAAISCFMLEHVENPEAILETISDRLKTEGYAFITTVITAAQRDHLTEFRKESEVISMLETNGFRVVSMYSNGPELYPKACKYLPRSIAMVVQKRHSVIW